MLFQVNHLAYLILIRWHWFGKIELSVCVIWSSGNVGSNAWAQFPETKFKVRLIIQSICVSSFCCHEFAKVCQNFRIFVQRLCMVLRDFYKPTLCKLCAVVVSHIISLSNCVQYQLGISGPMVMWYGSLKLHIGYTGFTQYPVTLDADAQATLGLMHEPSFLRPNLKCV